MLFTRKSLTALSLTVLIGTASAVANAPNALADTTTDVAPSSSINYDTTGPSDSTFQNSEAQYNVPLIGTDAWHGFCRQNGRDIVISLPQNYAIQSLSIEMDQNPGSGVYYPNHVDFEVYSNGNWYKIGTARSAIPGTDKRVTTQTFAVNAHNVQGSQFRIRFPVAVWVFTRHIHVLASSNTSGSAPIPNLPVDPTPYSNPLSAYDTRAHGIHNMLIAYTGDHGDQGTWSQSDFLPMIAYTQPNGQVGGRMFDTMLFGPYWSMADSQVGWQGYLQDLFRQGQQLSALDAAVAEQNQAMGTPGFKEKIVLTIPYPVYGDGSWGQANGMNVNFNGSNVDPNALTAREAALQWYIQTTLADWNAAHFQNLQLTGLYWNSEQINYNSPGEVPLLKYGVSLAHQNNLPLFWIPFYDASGIEDWQTVGFDATYLQPNLIEQGVGADPSRIQHTEQYATKNGLGVELELTDDTLYNSGLQSQYLQTLNQFSQDQFAGNVSHAFYAGSKLFVTAASSTDSSIRTLYDETYQFITHP